MERRERRHRRRRHHHVEVVGLEALLGPPMRWELNLVEERLRRALEQPHVEVAKEVGDAPRR